MHDALILFAPTIVQQVSKVRTSSNLRRIIPSCSSSVLPHFKKKARYVNVLTAKLTPPVKFLSCSVRKGFRYDLEQRTTLNVCKIFRKKDIIQSIAIKCEGKAMHGLLLHLILHREPQLGRISRKEFFPVFEAVGAEFKAPNLYSPNLSLIGPTLLISESWLIIGEEEKPKPVACSSKAN